MSLPRAEQNRIPSFIPVLPDRNPSFNSLFAKSYGDIFSCARFFLTAKIASADQVKAASDLVSYIYRDEKIKNYLLGPSTSFGHRLSDELAFQGLEHSLSKSMPFKRDDLAWLMEAAVELIMLYDREMSELEKMRFLEETASKNPDNELFTAAYTKLKKVLCGKFNRDFNILFVEDHLAPVLTFVPNVDQRKCLDAHLSFITVTRADRAKGVTMPQKIMTQDELMFSGAMAQFLALYNKIPTWENSILDTLLNCAYYIIKRSPPENIAFLKERFAAICGEGCPEYWDLFTSSRDIYTLKELVDKNFDTNRIKALCDYCAFIMALVLFYGGGDIMQELRQRCESELRAKYKNSPVLDKFGVSALPIDYSFLARPDGPPEGKDGHNSLLKAMKKINPNTRVQISTDSLCWMRDTCSWLDEDFTLLLHSSNPMPGTAQGTLSEGGSIIPGKSRNKFLLVSKDALQEEFRTAQFFAQAAKSGIAIYTLPGGFSCARNTRTNEDVYIQTSHIDTVINIIPANCTADSQLRVIVDPDYYGCVEKDPEFLRFCREQSIAGQQIVIIDKREAYLNLANFSTILDKEGDLRLLFNRDKGYTLPLLGLKPGVLIQPDKEIINLSAFNGSIRCATNLLPESQLKQGSSLLIIPENGIPETTRREIVQFFLDNHSLAKGLSLLWISSLRITSRLKQSSYSLENLSRSLFINLSSNDLQRPHFACQYIENCIKKLIARTSRKMGLNFTLGELENHVVSPLAVCANVPEPGYFIALPSGNLLKIDREIPQMTSHRFLDFYKEELAKIQFNPLLQKLALAV